MFESLISKQVKCVFKDGTSDKGISGIFKKIEGNFILIYTKDRDMYVNINSIISLSEREDETK
jgi:hypothetical protein